MERNAPEAVDLLTETDVRVLKQYLRAECHMDSEINFIHIDANDPEREIVDRLWNVLTFRPDVASGVEQRCRGKSINMIPFADLLRKAIEAADWPEDLW